MGGERSVVSKKTLEMVMASNCAAFPKCCIVHSWVVLLGTKTAVTQAHVVADEYDGEEVRGVLWTKIPTDKHMRISWLFGSKIKNVEHTGVVSGIPKSKLGTGAADRGLKLVPVGEMSACARSSSADIVKKEQLWISMEESVGRHIYWYTIKNIGQCPDEGTVLKHPTDGAMFVWSTPVFVCLSSKPQTEDIMKVLVYFSAKEIQRPSELTHGTRWIPSQLHVCEAAKKSTTLSR
ncbi:hypothetical protein BU23DRAFT_634221 [Bimuria novae-zelandiae CBS 107.79]|uniref:Uncharacterized protein n=1 Tax=Bimuria novae-zelandiae CBS 107.79 TaxID=1447943 RepID=A0A6A5VCH7_9PLEO|nr:hypothetical protein BU23DRAFT_634221 [Bimuria novae-zelandiae CBS 107.79]